MSDRSGATTAESAVDRLSQASQRTASDVERLAALVNALQARITSLESQLEATGSARTATADRLERLAAGLQRLERFERNLGEIRSEMTSVAGEAQRRLEAATKEWREQGTREHEQVVRAFDDFGERLNRIEAARDRDDTAARIESVARDVTRVGHFLQQVDDRASRLEQAPPRTDPAVSTRLDAFDGAIEDLRDHFDAWQRKIEEQSEIVRRARSVADSMRGQVDEISRAHHATAEAQRIAEARTEKALQALQAEGAEKWARFETARRHEWDKLAKELSERASAAAVTSERIEELAAHLDALATSTDEELDETRSVSLERYRRIVTALQSLRDATMGMLDETELGLPTGERSSVEDERKAARRRAFRARRSSASD